MAIARQESELDARAASDAGARGLMQLMPATARAHRRGRRRALDVSAGWPTDPLYNARLGTEYLARMLDRYDGSYVLATAAYNAGPGRVDQWIATLGDPRDGRRRPGGLDRGDPLHRDPQLRDARARVAARLPRPPLGRPRRCGSSPTSAAPVVRSRRATSTVPPPRRRGRAGRVAEPPPWPRQLRLPDQGVEAGGEDQRGAGDGPAVGALAEERRAP